MIELGNSIGGLFERSQSRTVEYLYNATSTCHFYNTATDVALWRPLYDTLRVELNNVLRDDLL